jgi:hypothetical protein
LLVKPPRHVHHLPFICNEELERTFDPEVGREESNTIFIRTEDLKK